MELRIIIALVLGIAAAAGGGYIGYRVGNAGKQAYAAEVQSKAVAGWKDKLATVVAERDKARRELANHLAQQQADSEALARAKQTLTDVHRRLKNAIAHAKLGGGARLGADFVELYNDAARGVAPARGESTAAPAAAHPVRVPARRRSDAPHAPYGPPPDVR